MSAAEKPQDDPAPPPARPRCDRSGYDAAEAARLDEALGWFERLGGKSFDGFLPALAAARCTVAREEGPFFGGYISYNDNIGGFDNRIILTPAALAEERGLFRVLAHEGIHALQSANCAALHALPHNRRTGIMLCPRDFIYALELCERDAYAKESLFNLMLEGMRRREGNAATPFQDLGGNTFRLAYWLQGRSVAAALAAAGEDILNTSRPRAAMAAETGLSLPAPGEGSGAPGDVPYKEVYNFKALLTYSSILDSRKDDLARGRLTFTRLEAEDIAAIGAFGPNPFTDDTGAVRPALLRPVPLSPENEEILQALNAALGITDEDALPPFGQALAARGITRESFLWAARLPPAPPKTLAPGPKPA